MRCTLSFDIVLFALAVGLVRDATAKALRKERQQIISAEQQQLISADQQQIISAEQQQIISAEQQQLISAAPTAQCYLTSPFRSAMYNGMWQYMNQDMMGATIEQLHPNASPTFTHTPGIDDYDCIQGDAQCHHWCTDANSKPCWPKKFHNTICFKGHGVNGGHYLYIGPNGHQYGSYENGLLIRDEDDGICHGVAMCAFLSIGLGDQRYALHWHPRGLDQRGLPRLDAPVTAANLPQFKENYLKILSLYQHVLHHIWGHALATYFPGHGSQEDAGRALAAVHEYIATEYGRGGKHGKRYDPGGCWVDAGQDGRTKFLS